MKCENGTPQTAPERPRTDGTDTAHGKPSEAQEAPLSPLEAQERACPPACLKQERSKSVSGWCPCPLEAGGKRGSCAVPLSPVEAERHPRSVGKAWRHPLLEAGTKHGRQPPPSASNRERAERNRPAEAPRKGGAKALCRERAKGKAGHRSQSEAREMQASNPE